MTELLGSTVRQSVGRPPDSSEALACTLDDLLVRYLHLLEQYQKLRQDLNKILSNVRCHPVIQSTNPDLWARVTYRLPKPISPIPTAFAMGKIITMIECKAQLLCTTIQLEPVDFGSSLSAECGIDPRTCHIRLSPSRNLRLQILRRSEITKIQKQLQAPLKLHLRRKTKL